jgi:uncharacterized protein (AIM24 family)
MSLEKSLAQFKETESKDLDGDDTFADPQAAITWSDGLKTSVKTNVSAKNLIGRGSGESFQMSFSGKGWVLVQPSEGRVAAPGAASGSSGGIGKILSG